MRKLLITCPGHKHVGSLVRTRYCHITSHLIHYWLSRNSIKQRTGESFQVQGLTFSIHLSPSLAWALKSQGRVGLGFSWHQTHGFSTNHPNHSQGSEHCQLTSDTISVELVPMPHVELSTLPWLQMPATCSWLIMCLDKWLKLEISTLSPCSKTQSYQWTKSGNFLITVLRVTHRKKLRNNEMEEIFRAGCSGVGCSLHALLSTAPSTHDRLAPPYKLSEPMFMDFYWGFTQEPYVLNHQPVVTDLSLSALLSPQRCRKF